MITFINNIQQLVVNIKRFKDLAKDDYRWCETFTHVQVWYLLEGTDYCAPARFAGLDNITADQYADPNLKLGTKAVFAIRTVTNSIPNLSITHNDPKALECVKKFCTLYNRSLSQRARTVTIRMPLAIEVDQAKFETIYIGLLQAVRALPQELQDRLKDAL